MIIHVVQACAIDPGQPAAVAASGCRRNLPYSAGAYPSNAFRGYACASVTPKRLAFGPGCNGGIILTREGIAGWGHPTRPGGFSPGWR